MSRRIRSSAVLKGTERSLAIGMHVRTGGPEYWGQPIGFESEGSGRY